MTFDTPEPISATVDVVVGDVRITAADRRDTVVDVQPSDPASREDVKAAEQTRVECVSGHLLVKAPKLRTWSIRSHGGSIDVTIALPAGSDVHGGGGLTDFHTEGRLGDCRIKTGLGRIEVDEAAKLSLKSGAGDISVVAHAHAGVGAKSANGDVRLGDVARGSVVLETKIGELEVGIREGSAAWLDVSSGHGRVHNALEAADAPAPSAETVRVRARTTIGDIVIGRP